MAGDRLRVEYVALSELAKSFANEAHEIDSLLSHIARRVWAEDMGDKSKRVGQEKVKCNYSRRRPKRAIKEQNG
jgi:hypothetical protein